MENDDLFEVIGEENIGDELENFFEEKPKEYSDLMPLDPNDKFEREFYNRLKEMIQDKEEGPTAKYVKLSEFVMNSAFSIPEDGNVFTIMNNRYKNQKVSGGPCRFEVGSKVCFVYRCLDCMKCDNTLICKSCFDRGNHTGHK